MSALALLLIDDDQSYCAVMKRAFVRRGYDVIAAHDGENAMRQAEARPFDGVILDLRLGEDSGLQLLAGLRERQAKARILLLTGYSSIATAVDAIKRGADQYLPKPAHTDEILNSLFGASAIPAVPTAPAHPRRLEWEHLQRVLADHEGNISATARALGLHRRTLQRKLSRDPPAEH